MIKRIIQFARQGYTQLDFDTYDTDWQSEAYLTVSGQNSNNSVRVTDSFLHADRTSDDDRALRVEKPVALVLLDAEVVGDNRELIAGHFEHRAGKEAAVHFRSPVRPPRVIGQ